MTEDYSFCGENGPECAKKVPTIEFGSNDNDPLSQVRVENIDVLIL